MAASSSAFDFGDYDSDFDADAFETKFREYVAFKMQAVWRGKQQRRRFQAERRAACYIQAQFRTSERRRAVRGLNPNPESGAILMGTPHFPTFPN
jgi:hypothetical protein